MTSRVPQALNERIEAALERVEKPARYMGGELNSEIKPRTQDVAAFAFCFPDTYEIAMSHLGLKVIYHVVNAQADMLCERVCMPWVDMAQLMRDEDIPLFSLETRTPLRDFETVGFTLQYEMSYTNILDMLSLGGVEPLAQKRAEDAPIVIAGGPCAFNPEPLADFIDAFLIGDGEYATVEIIRQIHTLRAQGTARQDILRALCAIPGVYVPSLYEAAYNSDGTLQSFAPIDSAAPAKVQKRLEADFDAAPAPDKIPLPYTEVVHDRIVLEIMRGCTRGCRFCQAGMLYRPVRERKAATLARLAQKLVDATGYEEISLSSLSSGDYSQLDELAEELTRRFKDSKVGLSLPSMRLDSRVRHALELTGEVRKTGLTLAPEAGTQRLRDVINKGVTQEDLLRAVGDAFAAGWSSVKLYFMIGLPTETQEDVLAIADVARAVIGAYFAQPKPARAPGLRVTCSASTFVPKPFTPFQWDKQDTLEEINQKQAALRQALKIKSVAFNWHEPELSFLEACVARGDRRLGQVIYAAWQRGCRLDGWREHFRYNLWLEAFRACSLDPAFYANRERAQDELLPWDFIDAGVNSAYLWQERERALAGIVTPDCREGCQGCGLKRFEGVCRP